MQAPATQASAMQVSLKQRSLKRPLINQSLAKERDKPQKCPQKQSLPPRLSLLLPSKTSCQHLQLDCMCSKIFVHSSLDVSETQNGEGHLGEINLSQNLCLLSLALEMRLTMNFLSGASQLFFFLFFQSKIQSRKRLI